MEISSNVTGTWNYNHSGVSPSHCNSVILHKCLLVTKRLCEMLEGYRKNWRHRSNLQELKMFSTRKVINLRATTFGRVGDMACKQSLSKRGTDAKQYIFTQYNMFWISTKYKYYPKCQDYKNIFPPKISIWSYSNGRHGPEILAIELLQGWDGSQRGGALVGY